LVLEDGPDLPDPSDEANRPDEEKEMDKSRKFDRNCETHKSASNFVALTRKGMRPKYSFGGTVRICRQCFEGLTGRVNAITLLSSFQLQGVKDPRGPVGKTTAPTV
jgi:hypothetical protein